MEERVTGSGGDGFAELLRELKDRSGLSYGALAKRLHMSTSTLHRYCNGTAVPNEYAPVERLARVCRATPEELVELHRRWILADAARGRKPVAGGAGAGAVADTPSGGAVPEDAEPGPGPDEPSRGTGGRLAHPAVPGGSLPEAAEADGAGARRRKRGAVLGGASLVAVVGAVVLAANLASPGGGDDQKADGDVVSASGTHRAPDSASPSASRSDKASGSPSASASASKGKGAGAGAPAGPSRSAGGATGTPITVGVRPYVYESPCSQHFLVDSEPEQVGPPAGESDAVRWSGAYGAVSSGEQVVALTVQGTGADTVVLEALHVRVVSKGAPLAWNDYSMGVGCGGNVETKSFDIDLDNGSPAVTVKNGQRDFPYKVSASDPEVFYVTAHAKAHDVRWDLTLDWRSGDRHGTVRVRDGDASFRTSADANRPGYDYPLGGGEWIERTEQQ
ncbi:helix-turn-helix domain-containing protein [Streptomyces sp. KL116D]|uniref:helix-turn-helix domain-containing protein n=1 Tax=Streptomyces sp. KL116D TaxID=3045152 RepID=UPI0035576202